MNFNMECGGMTPLFKGATRRADQSADMSAHSKKILCTEKDHTVVKYSVLNESRQLFASKYRLYLPSEEELRAEIEREREMVVREAQERYMGKITE